MLVLSGVVDRDTSADDDVQGALNDLVGKVRTALFDPGFRRTLCASIDADERNYIWVDQRSGEPLLTGDFFTDFAGQSRKRWHYGIADPIVTGIERSFAADHGRGWLRDSTMARKALLQEFDNSGLLWFDLREIRQIISATIIVAGTAGGSFIISYFTPTVGLGCRSGGYMVFTVLAFGLALIEMSVWRWANRKTGLLTWLDRALVVGELSNASWLIWVTMAQTVGAYQSCSCMASNWGHGGGYVNFGVVQEAPGQAVKYFWATGTSLACFILAVSFGFIVLEWCEQSHLCTVHYGNAAQGLRSVRRFKRWTYWARIGPNSIIRGLEGVKSCFIGRRNVRKSLIWTVASPTALRRPENNDISRLAKKLDIVVGIEQV